MRVISGKYKGKKIYTPRRKIKPTSSVVRKAIFDFLGDFIEGKKVLDLYAGTGALGIEALSRGADKVVFVEKDFLCVQAIEKNVSQFKDVQTEIVYLDVITALGLLRGSKFDVVFMDPPYKESVIKSVLKELLNCDIVKSNSVVIVEHHKKEVIRDEVGDFILLKQKKYGETVISVFQISQ